MLSWLMISAPISFVFGLLALAVVVTVPAATLVALLWWAAPEGQPLMLSRIAITDWPTAIWASALHIAIAALLAVLVVPVFARWHAQLTLALLAPSATERLAARVETLAQTRAGAVDTHQAELRRIERDLHDGTQARLVAINLRLGMARRVLSTDPPAAAKLLDQARDGAEAAMDELRGMIRTIYPPILADRGLSGALQSLAAQATPPVRLVAGAIGKLPAAVEVAAYYAVSEALANAARHGAATTVMITVERVSGTLRVKVTDDGIGGADETRGSGIQGIRRRVAALDGVTTVDSPPGGPTTITVELPCE
ncbi:histidine kinase [Planotetraspora thailandica]|uniref:histidine kinase n=1 Tax=Planotetraspora thailandica TaxID=487172 RepID=A0A8J3VAT0_9ACTN|nr:histidine kinase [Planotetraspora thailandica]